MDHARRAGERDPRLDGRGRGRVEIERRRAVAERLDLDAQHLQAREHHVGHRRAVGRLQVQVALHLTAGVAEDEEWAPLVIVHVGVPHRRPVDDERVLEEVALAIGSALQLLQEVGEQAHVPLVDLRKLQDPILTVGMM